MCIEDSEERMVACFLCESTLRFGLRIARNAEANRDGIEEGIIPSSSFLLRAAQVEWEGC